jgi:hypothetical protein
LLAPALAAARYDPTADRFALRTAATACNTTVIDSTGRPLLPENVPAIVAGIDEGLRQGTLASGAAESLAGAARARSEEMDTAVHALEATIKERAAPVVEARDKAKALDSALSGLKRELEKRTAEERERLRSLVSKAEGLIVSASEALRPAEGAIETMAERSSDMKGESHAGRKSLVEVSFAAAGTVARAGDLPFAAGQLKERLDAVIKEPGAASQTRTVEKIEILRGLTRLLFESADRACNRADDLRRHSTAFNRALEDFERAKSAATTAPAKTLLDEARRLLATLRERLSHHK